MIKESKKLLKYINTVYIAYGSSIMSGEGEGVVCGPIPAFFEFFENIPIFKMVYSSKMPGVFMDFIVAETSTFF